jgi:hypothetical protein
MGINSHSREYIYLKGILRIRDRISTFFCAPSIFAMIQNREIERYGQKKDTAFLENQALIPSKII